MRVNLNGSTSGDQFVDVCGRVYTYRESFRQDDPFGVEASRPYHILELTYPEPSSPTGLRIYDSDGIPDDGRDKSMYKLIAKLKTPQSAEVMQQAHEKTMAACGHGPRKYTFTRQDLTSRALAFARDRETSYGNEDPVRMEAAYGLLVLFIEVILNDPYHFTSINPTDG
jgi:hypothetical protein